MTRTIFSLNSPQAGTDYQIYVEAPESADEPGPWPALLFLDGDDLFELAKAAYGELRAVNAVPPLLLVGVGYGALPMLFGDWTTFTFAKSVNKRLRDYTATHIQTEPESGGANAFLAFLTDTLLPELAQRYPVRSEACGLAGHSLGSLAVIHALFQTKPVFTRFLASAPSLWWDDRSPLKQIPEQQESSPKLSANLHLSIGLDDTPEMIEDFGLLEQQLAATPFNGLELTIQRFPQRDHYTVIGDAFRDGMSKLFAESPEFARTSMRDGPNGVRF
jgi:predicted alpha/beta superfamily hydrolase